MATRDCFRCSLRQHIDPNCPECGGAGKRKVTNEEERLAAAFELRLRATPKPGDRHPHLKLVKTT